MSDRIKRRITMKIPITAAIDIHQLGFKIALSVVAAVGLLIVPSASATGTIDQSQTTTSGLSVTTAASQWTAQTFTAGITGNLDQVDLFLFRVGSAGDLTVQIQTVSGGVPSGNVLASTTLAEANVSASSYSWISVPLSPPAPVTAGTQYAIVLSAPRAAGFPSALYTWNFVFANPYSGGRLVLSSTSGSSWGDFASVFDDGDTAFKTYVTPLLTSGEQCKNGGWTNFPQFKNQGDCVSFVAAAGQNPPE
jgi:hypothetical protein